MLYEFQLILELGDMNTCTISWSVYCIQPHI